MAIKNLYFNHSVKGLTTKGSKIASQKTYCKYLNDELLPDGHTMYKLMLLSPEHSIWIHNSDMP